MLVDYMLSLREVVIIVQCSLPTCCSPIYIVFEKSCYLDLRSGKAGRIEYTPEKKCRKTYTKNIICERCHFNNWLYDMSTGCMHEYNLLGNADQIKCIS